MNPADMTLEQLAALFGYTPRHRRLKNEEAAELLGIQPNTLEVKRVHGTGPRYYRLPNSRRVFYVEKDVLEFMASGARMSTSAPARLSA